MNRARTNYALALFATIAASIFGFLMMPSIPSAVFPEVVFPRAIVLAQAGQLPREQMLVAVTRPLEEAAYGVVGTSLVRSTTSRGSAEIDVTFQPGADPVTSFQLLNAALSEARTRLPPAAEYQTRLLTTGVFPIIDLSLSSRDRTLPELTDIALYDIIPSFHQIPGTYRVEMVGGKYREFVVRLDPPRMLARALTPQQVVAGLAAANVVASPGRMLDEHRMMLTVLSAELHTRDQIGDVPVANQDGQPIHVRDLGTVELGVQEDYIRASSENGPSVLIGISRQPDGNTGQISDAAHALVERFKQRYPDVTFSFSYDQADLVRESVTSVRDAIALGLALSFLIVLGFTLSPLSAAIALLVVGACVLCTVVVMKAAGVTFNMMTLGGLAAGIGLFIDDAIVMIEAIHRERASGLDTADAIAGAHRELARPLIASTLTVIVVFAPLVFLPGVTGTFFRALSVTLGAGLAISLVLALYVTPALEMFAAEFRGRTHPEGALFGLVSHAYVAVTGVFIRWPALSVALFAAMIAIGAGLLRVLGTDYLPELDEGAFVLDYNTPPQSTMADTSALLGQIESVLMQTPEVASFARRTGTQLGFFLTESNRGDMSVRLKPQRTRGIDRVMDSVRQRIEQTLPGVRVEFSQLLQDLLGDLSGTPEPIEIKVFGPDQHTIENTAREIAARVRTVPGVVDVFDGIVFTNPEQQIAVDTTAAERHEVSAEDVHAALEAVLEGTVATHVRAGDRLFGVRVRYPQEFHTDLGALSAVLLQTPHTGMIPLSAIASLKWGGEQSELARERLSPVIHVTARLSGQNLGDAIAAIKQRLRAIALPPGVRLEFGGLYAEQQRAFAGLTMVLIAGAMAVFVVLLWEFARLGPAVAVLAGAIPCLAGGLLGLQLTGITLNVSSFMGIIMVVGIAAKNGILLLDQAEREVAGGVLTAQALANATRVRIRPITMTALATAAGLLPLALGLGAGAKVQQPLAMVVIGGLLFSMVLSIPLAGGVYLMMRRPTSSEAHRFAGQS